MLRSLGVVAGSSVLSVLLVIATDPLLSVVCPGDFVRNRIPSTVALVTSTLLFVIASFVCAWVCARFAPTRPALLVLWFIGIGEVMGIAAAVPNWSNGWPHWYWLAWILTWPASCYLGLLLAQHRSTRLAV